jgi:hypothetical protein
MRIPARADRINRAFAADRRTEPGHALEPSVRAAMEPAFGHDFATVRIHADADAGATADDLGALAYTVGHDVVFGSGQYAPDTPRGRQVLAHELTHVVQNDRYPYQSPPDSLTQTSDTVEREARDVSRQVMRGESVDVQSPPTAAVAPFFGWLDVAEKWMGGGGSEVDPAAADGASPAWEGVKDAGSSIHDGMKQNAAYVREGVEWAENGIDWLADEASSGVRRAADQVEDVPILGDVAQGGAWAADQLMHLTGGVLKGATTLGGSLLQVVANPVDTAIGLKSMGEHMPVSPISPFPNSFKLARGFYDAVTTDATLGETLGRAISPTISEEDAAYWGQVAHGFAEPYAKDWEKGNYAGAIGRAGFDIASLFVGAGEANAASKGARAGTVVSDAARAAELGDAARAAELAEAARASVAGGTARAGAVSDVARGVDAAVEIGAAAEGGGAVAALEQRALASEARSASLVGTEAETSFAGLIETDATPIRYRSAAEAAQGATDAGLVNLDEGRLGFQTYNVSGSVREALGQTGTSHESAHMFAQDMGAGVVEHSSGSALTSNLPRPAHRAFDKGWVSDWKAAKAAGEQVTASSAHEMLTGAVQAVDPALLSPAAKGTMQWKIFDEMFRTLGLPPDRPILPRP